MKLITLLLLACNCWVLPNSYSTYNQNQEGPVKYCRVGTSVYIFKEDVKNGLIEIYNKNYININKKNTSFDAMASAKTEECIISSKQTISRLTKEVFGGRVNYLKDNKEIFAVRAIFNKKGKVVSTKFIIKRKSQIKLHDINLFENKLKMNLKCEQITKYVSEEKYVVWNFLPFNFLQ